VTAEAHAVSITPGTRFAGFEIVSRRFSGAASDIWEAVPATPSSRLPAGVTPARIALKTLQPQFLLDDGARASFARVSIRRSDSGRRSSSSRRISPRTLRPAPGTELDHIVHELVLATSSSDEEDSPITPEAPDPRAQSAALEFDRGWRALCDGRRWDALAAWETALVLDPQNPTYAVDVRHLREKLLQ
jgi:hypothetical protein